MSPSRTESTLAVPAGVEAAAARGAEHDCNQRDGPQAVGTHTSVVWTTRTSPASSRIGTVSTASAFAAHFSSISATSSRISCSSSARSGLGELGLLLGALLPLRGARAHAAAARGAAERAAGARDRARVGLAAEQDADDAAEAGEELGAAARGLLDGRLLDPLAGGLERSLEPVALLLEAIADLRRLGVRGGLRRLVRTRGELLRRLAGTRVEVELGVAEQLERLRVGQAPLDLAGGVAEEGRLVERDAREHVGGAVGRLGAEVAVVVVDGRLAVEVEPGVERAVDGLPFLRRVEVGLRVVEAKADARGEEGLQPLAGRVGADLGRPGRRRVEPANGNPVGDGRRDSALVVREGTLCDCHTCFGRLRASRA